MTRSPAKLWCPYCKKYHPCRSLSPSDIGAESGHTFYRTDHEDLQYFRRYRECEECGKEFETAEVEAKFLDELVKLRTALAGIRLDTAAYEDDAKKTAEKLNKLGEWLAGLKALK